MPVLSVFPRVGSQKPGSMEWISVQTIIAPCPDDDLFEL